MGVTLLFCSIREAICYKLTAKKLYLPLRCPTTANTNGFFNHIFGGCGDNREGGINVQDFVIHSREVSTSCQVFRRRSIYYI